MKIEDFKIYQFHFGNCKLQIVSLYVCVFWHQSLDSNLRHLLHGLKFEPVTEPGLKLSLFVKCIESEFTDSAKYFQNLRQSLNF